LPVEAEAMGLLQALNWLSFLGYSNVCIKLDCKSIVDAIF